MKKLLPLIVIIGLSTISAGLQAQKIDYELAKRKVCESDLLHAMNMPNNQATIDKIKANCTPGKFVPPPTAGGASSSPPTPPAPSAPKSGKLDACIKDATAKKLVGPAQASFVTECMKKI